METVEKRRNEEEKERVIIDDIKVRNTYTGR